MRILGIDPGLATIGLGLIDARCANDITVCEWLTLKTKPGPLPQRLEEIHKDLALFLSEAEPELAVVERLFFGKNETTGIEVSHARGCILLALAQQGIPILEPTPIQLKSCITGDGKAEKMAVRDMLVRTLRLTEIPRPDDAADALALAVYGAAQMHCLALSPITAA